MFLYDVFLICPVRYASDEQKVRMENYIARLEKSGKKVYYPTKDTNQIDETGLRICVDNTDAIRKSREIHIYFDPESRGTLFDLGAAFMAQKKIVIANPDDFPVTEGKSFGNMIREWSKQ